MPHGAWAGSRRVHYMLQTSNEHSSSSTPRPVDNNVVGATRHGTQPPKLLRKLHSPLHLETQQDGVHWSANQHIIGLNSTVRCHQNSDTGLGTGIE